MSWQDKAKEWGGGDVSFLSEDGEVVCFVVCGEPQLLISKFKGTPTERIAAPIVTLEGFSLLVIGKRLFRRLSKHEKKFKDSAFMVIRRGESGDSNTKYELTVIDDERTTANLFTTRDAEFKPAMITEAMKAAADIMAE